MRFALAIWFAAGFANGDEPAEVIGKIGGIEIKAVEIRESLAGLDETRRQALVRDPAALAQYVRALLMQRLVLDRAVEERWDQRPDVISKLVRAREETLAESYLEAASAPPDGYPSDDEVKAAYDAHKDNLLVPKSYRLAQIFIQGAKDGSPADEGKSKERLELVKRRLAAKNADFASIARELSDDRTSGKQGGELGWLSAGQILPEIGSKLPGMKAGSVSEPIPTADGWHFLKVIETRDERQATLDEVRDELVTNLRLEKRRINRQEFVAKLLREHPLAINEIELLKSVAPAPK